MIENNVPLPKVSGVITSGDAASVVGTIYQADLGPSVVIEDIDMRRAAMSRTAVRGVISNETMLAPSIVVKAQPITVTPAASPVTPTMPRIDLLSARPYALSFSTPSQFLITQSSHYDGVARAAELLDIDINNWSYIPLFTRVFSLLRENPRLGITLTLEKEFLAFEAAQEALTAKKSALAEGPIPSVPQYESDLIAAATKLWSDFQSNNPGAQRVNIWLQKKFNVKNPSAVTRENVEILLDLTPILTKLLEIPPIFRQLNAYREASKYEVKDSLQATA